MDDTERDNRLNAIAATIGDDAFNRLVASVKEVRQQQRLRFWQEELLGKAGLSFASSEEFLELFSNAQWRATGRARDPLTAATTSLLKPAVTAHGFHKLGSRTFARVLDGVLQYFCLQLSAWGGKDFAVNYASITIFSPRERFVIMTGGRLPRGKSSDGWWSSKTHEMADNSMREIVGRFETELVPWFTGTNTTAKLLSALRTEHEKSPRLNAHYLFDISCCHAHLNQLPETQDSLEKAIAVYRDWQVRDPVKTWCQERVARCEQLLSAIRSNQHQRLLAEWLAISVKNLKLEKIV